MSPKREKELDLLLGLGRAGRRRGEEPGHAPRVKGEVEAVHRLEEDDLIDLESFSAHEDFLAKTNTYQIYFNPAQPNSHKDIQTRQIIERLTPRHPSISPCFHRPSWIIT